MLTKELIVVAGPNGAGKTTFIGEFLKRHTCVYLSADAIAAEMALQNPASVQFEAGREFLNRVEQQLAAGQDWIVETTLSGRSFRHVLDRAKSAGFQITVVFIYVDTADASLARVRERVRKGGHDVPEEDVRRRFSRTFTNFWHVYRKIADYWHVIYNAGGYSGEIAFGDGDRMAILDQHRFLRFLELVGVTADDSANH
jgi:predicted ABC-type ATPase